MERGGYGSVLGSEDTLAHVPSSSPSISGGKSKSARHNNFPSCSSISTAIRFSFCLGLLMMIVSLSIDSDRLEWYKDLDYSPSMMAAQHIADYENINKIIESESKKKHNSPTSANDGCETTVLILRHCEKGDSKSHCDYIGFERSVYLATLFGNQTQDRWPVPSFIYALSPKKRHNPRKRNFREIETVQPLADKFGLPINNTFGTSDDKHLAKTLTRSMKQGDLCGKVTVISWKHSDIPALARRLGCGPLEGCPLDYKGKEFDDIWQIKYVYRKFTTGKHVSKKTYWKVYGNVQRERFDPLEFSKKMGDYPVGGSKVAGKNWLTTSEFI